MTPRRIVIAAIAALLIVAGAICAVRISHSSDTSRDDVADAHAHAADRAGLDPASVARGRQIAIASDCAACHTRPGGGATYAGGYVIETPFGGITTSNITPDRETGIGNWTERDFFRAVRHGRSPDGLLYPAMPYTAYVQMTDRDAHDLWSYVRSLPAVNAQSGGNRLPFPFNIRQLMIGWNMLFFANRPFAADPAKPAAWNRGRYLVDALGHCAACHTPKTLLGSDRTGRYLQGGKLQGWFAPELSGGAARGLGGWSIDETVRYLKTGANGHSVAAGPMAEAVEHSTQWIADDDLRAMAGYLASLPGTGDTRAATVAADDPAMRRGAHVYEIACSACHAPDGGGIPEMATRLAGNPGVRATDPASLVHVVLKGARAASTATNPTATGMPAFDWKLTDADAAAALTFVRNSWGNSAPAVTASDVADARKALNARAPM